MSGVQTPIIAFWLVNFFWRCSSIYFLICIIDEEMLVYLPFCAYFSDKEKKYVYSINILIDVN